MKSRILVALAFLLVFNLISAEKSDRTEIFENNLWKQLHTDYNPDVGLIEVLKSKISKADSIEIYFAFWCSDSENNVPQFIKILDKAGVDETRVNYIKVGRKKSGEKYYFVDRKVERVPTFIFYKDGKELGRIIENPKISLEEDSLEILF